MPCTIGQKRKTIKSQQRLKTEALQQAAGTLLGLGKQLQTHLMLPLIRVTAVHAKNDIILPNWFCEFFAELAWSKGISFGWNNSVCNVSSPGLNEYGAASLALHNYSSKLDSCRLLAPWARECGMFGFVLSRRIILADCSCTGVVMSTAEPGTSSL